MEERDDVIVLTDEEGNEADFMVIDGVEYNGKTYLMLVAACEIDDDESEAIMLRIDEEEGEEILVSVDDEDEFKAVATLFEENYEDNEEYDVLTPDDAE